MIFTEYLQFQEVKDNSTLEGAQVTSGLLRVKKEEELQETPGPEGGGPAASLITNNNGTSAELTSPALKKEPNQPHICASTPTTTTIIVGRRPSPPPEDWKPLDKCYFCLDGKLQQDEQPPLVSSSLNFDNMDEKNILRSENLSPFFRVHKAKAVIVHDLQNRLCLSRSILWQR